MNDDLVSFIIPNRGGKDLDKVIKNINDVYDDMNKEIIIIEQCDEKPFMRGQCYNIGVKFAKGKYIALTDNDIYHLRKVPWIDIYENYKKVLIGWKWISQITLINGKANITSTKEIKLGFGAFNFLSKEDFIKANGFSNLYIGWGSEDNEFADRTEHIRIPQNLGHLTHPKRLDLFPKNRVYNWELYKAKNRKKETDGYSQTTFKLIDQKQNDNVITIKVNDISVSDDFLYKEILKKQYKLAGF